MPQKSLIEVILEDHVQNIPLERTHHVRLYAEHLAERPPPWYKQAAAYMWRAGRNIGLGAAAGTAIGYALGDMVLGAKTGAMSAAALEGLDLVVTGLARLSRKWQMLPDETKRQKLHTAAIGHQFKYTTKPIATTLTYATIYAFLFGVLGGVATGEGILSAGIGAAYGTIDSLRMILKGLRTEKKIIDYANQLPKITPGPYRGSINTPM